MGFQLCGTAPNPIALGLWYSTYDAVHIMSYQDLQKTKFPVNHNSSILYILNVNM